MSQLRTRIQPQQSFVIHLTGEPAGLILRTCTRIHYVLLPTLDNAIEGAKRKNFVCGCKICFETLTILSRFHVSKFSKSVHRASTLFLSNAQFGYQKLHKVIDKNLFRSQLKTKLFLQLFTRVRMQYQI